MPEFTYAIWLSVKEFKSRLKYKQSNDFFNLWSIKSRYIDKNLTDLYNETKAN